MESIAILLIIVTLIIVFQLKNKINDINFKIDKLNEHINKLNFTSEKTTHEKDYQDIVTVSPLTEPEQSHIEESEPLLTEESPITKEFSDLQTVNEEINEPEYTFDDIIEKPYKPSFMERNPDLEKFIGENLLSKIGIVIFVIGMGFLIKLGIDNNMINESMRVVIGVLIGVAMIGLAHYLRKSFSTFSSVLIGGAMAVLYFTIAIAFHEYELISQIAAFIIMVFITAFVVLLSIGYDRKELAVLAIIGGFCTPFFVSTGEADIINLFSYILILDIGMLFLVYFKKWNIINHLAFAFTYILFAYVYISEFIVTGISSTIELFIFLTAFYLIFFLMSIIYNVKNNRKFKFAEVEMLLSNSAIYFGLGLSLVDGFNGGLYKGLFTGLTALFNFIFAVTLFRREGIDKNLIYLLIGLVLTFLTLIAPIQLKGNFITMFWALESVLLLWLSMRSGIRIMRLVSIILIPLMLISLFLDWDQLYINHATPMLFNPFLNKAFITSFISMGSLFVFSQLFNKEENFSIKMYRFSWKPIFVKIILLLVIYGGLYVELNYQFIRYELDNSHRTILLGIFNFAFIIIIGIVPYFRSSAIISKSLAVLSFFAIVSYMTGYLIETSLARDNYLSNPEINSSGFYAHYVLLFLFIIIVWSLSRTIYSRFGFKSKIGNITLWILAFIAVYISSAEIGHISVMYNFDTSGDLVYKNAVKNIYPIVWAITALILMSLGMKFKLKTLRLASLGLFSITIVKLFAYDLEGNSTGKIISFILLGVILLLISFLYQKLKFIIQDDDKKA